MATVIKNITLSVGDNLLCISPNNDNDLLVVTQWAKNITPEDKKQTCTMYEEQLLALADKLKEITKEL